MNTPTINEQEKKILVSLHLQGKMGPMGSMTKDERLKLLQGLITKGLLTEQGQVTELGKYMAGPDGPKFYSLADRQWLRRKLLRYESNYNKTQNTMGIAGERAKRENQMIYEDIKKRGLLDCDLECSTRQFLLKNKID